MNINVILPPFFFNPDSQGFNEMLASEIVSVCEPFCNVPVHKEFPLDKADILFIPFNIERTFYLIG